LNFPIYGIDIHPSPNLNYPITLKIYKELADYFKDIPEDLEKFDVKYQ
jgi:hypothetical protein